MNIAGRALLWVCSALLFFMMVIITLEALLRYGFNTSLVWPYEVTEYSMVAITFLSLAYVQARKRHIFVEVVVTRLSSKPQAWLNIIVSLLGLAYFSLIIYGVWGMAYESLKYGLRSTTAAHLPLFPFQLIVPLGSLVLCLQFLTDIAANIRQLVRRSEQRLGESK